MSQNLIVKKSFNTVSVAVVIAVAFASLFLVLMLVMFYANRQISESFYTGELIEYGERHIKSLDVLIQQDLLNGFYPAVVQKTSRFMESADIVSLRVVLADGTELFNSKKIGLSEYYFKTIQLNVMSVGAGLSDVAVNVPIAKISADLSHKRVSDQINAQQKDLVSLWSIGALLGSCLIYLLGRRIAMPIERLKSVVSRRDLKEISGIEAGSRITELRDLEHEFSEMGKRLFTANQLVRRNAEFELVAKTTQMLAHDVRRPFSIFRAGLSLLRTAKSEAERKQVLGSLIAESERGINKVDGLIADVMEMGSPSIRRDPVDLMPEELIANSLREIFRAYPHSDVGITYDFNHDSCVRIEQAKVSRVFDNIVANAVQAIGLKGRIWFRTRTRENFCEFTIGNAGSFIPEDVRAQLFETFFTIGKKGGTGLGLAIAQKIVEAHGGSISCTSERNVLYPDGFVDFVFTLPNSKPVARYEVSSPIKHSREVELLPLVTVDLEKLLSGEQGVPVPETRILPEIILIEDNVFLLEAWHLKLKPDAIVHSYSSPELFLEAMGKDWSILDRVLFVMVDFYFENSKKNGLDLASKMKERNRTIKIIMCSDRGFYQKDIKELIDRVIEKDPVDLQSLLAKS